MDFAIEIQEEGENTCVACATLNALRHFGQDGPPVDELMAILRVPRRTGSYVHKAAKYLAREYGFHIQPSRAPYLIRDPFAAAAEAATRYGDLVKQGFVGLLHRRESRNVGHAVVLTEVYWQAGEPFLVTYDSNKRHRDGRWTYRGVDYVTLIDVFPGRMTYSDWMHLPPAQRSDDELKVTGRSAWFVRPPTTITGANC